MSKRTMLFHVGNPASTKENRCIFYEGPSETPPPLSKELKNEKVDYRDTDPGSARRYAKIWLSDRLAGGVKRPEDAMKTINSAMLRLVENISPNTTDRNRSHIIDAEVTKDPNNPNFFSTKPIDLGNGYSIEFKKASYASSKETGMIHTYSCDAILKKEGGDPEDTIRIQQGAFLLDEAEKKLSRVGPDKLLRNTPSKISIGSTEIALPTGEKPLDETDAETLNLLTDAVMSRLQNLPEHDPEKERKASAKKTQERLRKLREEI